MRRHRRVTRRALRREVNRMLAELNRVLAELDQRNPGTLNRRDREVWTPVMLDRLWRDLRSDQPRP
jgi:hypothetical protein